MKDACISICGKYRSWLSRRTLDYRTILYIMLNPSIADALVDDATIRRCNTFAAREQKGTILVANLFTLRSPKPKYLWESGIEPVGPDAVSGLEFLLDQMQLDDLVVAAWGSMPSGAPKSFKQLHASRIVEVMAQVERRGFEPMCFGLTSAGAPKHPGRIAAISPLVPYRAAVSKFSPSNPDALRVQASV